MLDAPEQIVGPQEPGVDGDSGGHLAAFRVGDGSTAGADLCGGFVEGEVAAQPGCPQISSEAAQRELNCVWRGDG